MMIMVAITITFNTTIRAGLHHISIMIIIAVKILERLCVIVHPTKVITVAPIVVLPIMGVQENKATAMTMTITIIMARVKVVRVTVQ